MNKCISGLFLLFFICTTAKADHITGGEMSYIFTGVSGGLYQYSGTLKLFMRCNSGRRFNDPTVISVFNKSTNSRVADLSVPLARRETISLPNADPCISNPPVVCYEVGYFTFRLSLPASALGYVLSSQVNYRINGISNLSNGYSQVGALYTAEIPGTSPVVNGPENNSATFVGSDLVIVCANNQFSYSFAATDSDGDQLRYSFCNAYQGNGNVGGPGNAGPTLPPPYQSVPYGSAYSGSAPLGSNVQVNATNGLITGKAPPSGIYVVTVCVQEIRNGQVIATQRKDLQINIAPCQVAAALLEPEYLLCKSSNTLTFSNISTSPLITTTMWELVNSAGSTILNSASLTPSYTFADTGLYTIKLAINRGQKCSDSAQSIVRVYPGMVTDFNVSGICINKPTVFTDISTTRYGTINSWSWDFGEPSVFNDISDRQNPAFTYLSMGQKNAALEVTTSKGCRDTLFKTISIVDKPPVQLQFKDTLICTPDQVQLIAGGAGNYTWTPGLNITGANTATPIVAPRVTTKYYVTLNDNGCINNDSVTVRVTDRVSLTAMNDTTICSSDSIRMQIISDGFRYSWTPAFQLSDPNSRNPVAITNSTTTYEVTASIGSCQAREQVVVTTVPYPIANAGADQTICFNQNTQLNGSTNGTALRWSPPGTLSNPQISNPVARPGQTTAYVLNAFDNKGCPKPGTDTVFIKVLADLNASAGNDTTAIVGQPLQLRASGGSLYYWTPATGLNNPNVPDPIARYDQTMNTIRYKVLVYEEGCVDSAYVSVNVYKTGPTVFVPDAFTPNADGTNDLLKPVAAGMSQMEFNVFNRWGQRVFSSAGNSRGWDGTVGGSPQGPGTFVWMVKGVDYTGKPYHSKGTVILIR
ncbi:T9SS type B sorting domain-containing protein [Segetibacter sp. 3557_3]|uniref:T9SS type B sorting domain-containing protein n=1 Tax=Segetibacter sp. 3557_3 TaxID=2547429 RepID=UPI001058E234|nr:gliding motility-associated C-terminal domain-containing protein [Segetibacter sp. 3557_3]TDH28792.1 T9SS type B sorting domain-containing protein [Segetibacter sp. 3557_3]